MKKPGNTYRLEEIEPTSIEFNEFNPRDESADEIADDGEFEQLKDSVYKYGVLVPIVVHEQHTDPAKANRYRLVDGERRLRAALATNLPRVPAHIAPAAAQLDELVQAFHIHMLRKQWKPIAQARALKDIRLLFKKEHPTHTEKELSDHLKEMIACPEKKLKDLRRAARYSDKVLKEVEGGAILYSHLVQFEESFVERLEEDFPQLLQTLGKRRVREVLVNKAKTKVLVGTRDLIDCVVPVLARANTDARQRYTERLISEFVEKEDMPATQVLEQFNQRFPPSDQDLVRASSEIVTDAQRLTRALKDLDSSEIGSFPKLVRDLTKSLDALGTIIGTTLKSITQR